MTAARLLPARDYNRLKAATRVLIEKAGGPSHLARTLGRISGKGTISKYGSVREEHLGTFIPLDVVADLEADTGLPEISRALAELSGYMLVGVPEAKGDASDWLAMLGDILSADAEVKSSIVDGLKAGEISGDEATDIRRCVRRLMEALAQVDAACGAVIGEGEQP